MMIAIA